VPADGPVLLLGNNPAAPLMIDGLPVSAHAVYTLDAVLARRRRPVWLLAVARYFELAERSKYVAEMLARMGFIPATLGNGTRLLQAGEVLIGYPEERASRPPYGLHPFAPAYVRMALDAGAPIVPVVFLGTHESHLLIEQGDRQILVNKTQRFRTNFHVTFLPPIDVRLELGANARSKAIEAFSEGMRLRMQAFINEQKKLRPLVNVVEQLQQRRLHIRRAGDPDMSDIADILGDI
jgi:1-acyl-sn-glycerol-3-phosphate acyltransferase